MSSSFFAGLQGRMQDPLTPWLLSDSLFQRVRDPSAEKNLHHECEILPSDPEWDFVRSYFFQYAPLTYSIKRIFCIHNPPQTEQFEASLLMMDGEAQNPVFSPKWQTEDPTGCRAKVMTRWRESAAAFSPVAVVRSGTCKRKEVLSHVFVFPYWHGSNQQKVQSICDTGFTYFGKHSYLQGDGTGSTDIGFFGSGIYFTNSARYAADIYSSGHLLLAWVSMRSPYPVIGEEEAPDKPSDKEKLQGRPAFENYDAHYIPVIAVNTSNPACPTYVACGKDQIPMWDETVVFNQRQTLPRFYVELMVTLPTSPTSPLTVVTQLLEDLQQLSAKTEIAENPQLLSLFQQKKQLLFVVGNSSALSSADQKFFDLVRQLQAGAAKIDDHVTQQFLALAASSASDTKPFLTPPSASSDTKPSLAPLSTSLDFPFAIPPMLEQCVPYKEILEAARVDKALAPPGSILFKVLAWRWIHGSDEQTWKIPCFEFDPDFSVLLLENGQVVTGCSDSVSVWDSLSGQSLRLFKRDVRDCSEHCSNKILSLGKGLLLFPINSRGLVIWDFSSEEIVQYLHLPFQFCDFVLLKNGYIAAVSDEQKVGKICLWKLFSKEAQKTFKVSFSCNEHIRLFSLGEEYLVIVTSDWHLNQKLTIWSPNEENCLFDETAYSSLGIGICLSEEEVVCWRGPSGFFVVNLSKDPSGKQRSKTKKLIGHKGEVLRCCRLRDGHVISGSEDKTLKIWDTQSCQCVKTLEGCRTPATKIWELKNGLIVSKERSGALGVWNPRSGKLLQTIVLKDVDVEDTFGFGSEDVYDIVDLGEGKVIFNFRLPSKAIIFDLLKGLSIFTFSEKVHCYGQLKNGSILCHLFNLERGESILRSIDPTSGRTLQTLGFPITSSPTDPYQLPDGRKLVISDCSIFLEERRGVFQCIVSDMTFVPLLFLKDGFVLVMKDGNFGVVDPRTGMVRNTFSHYGGRVIHRENYGKLISCPGGKIVALSENQIDIWDRRCDQIIKSLPLKGNSKPFFLSEKVRFLARSFGEKFQVFLERPKVLSARRAGYELKAIELQNSWIVGISEGRFLKVWDAKGKCLRVLKGHEAKVSVAIELQGKRLISGSEDGILKIWDLQSGKCLHTLKGYKGEITAICELKDGCIASGARRRDLREKLCYVKIWSPQGTCLHAFSHTDSISSILSLKDGRLVTFSEDGIYNILNLIGDKCEQEVTTQLKGDFQLAQCQDGNLLIFNRENDVCAIFDLKTGKALSQPVAQKSFRISEEKIVSFFDGKAFLWNLASGKCIRQLQSPSSGVEDCILLQDGSLLISFKDGTLQKWEQSRESCVKTWCREEITALVQLRDGRIVTGLKSTLKVWSPDMQECLSTWNGYSGGSLLQLEDGSLIDEFGCGEWNVKTGERIPLSVDIEWVRYKMKIQKSTYLCGPSLDQSLCKVLDLSQESDLQWALRNELQQIYVGIELHEGFLVYEYKDYTRTLQVLDPKTNILLGAFENTGPVDAVFLLKDGSLATTSSDEVQIRILDPCTGKCLRVLGVTIPKPIHPSDQIERLRMLNDAIPGGISSSVLKIWNSLSETLKTSFPDFHNLLSMTQLEDDSIALSVSDRNIKIWNKERSECLETLGGKLLQKGLLLLQDGSILNWLKGNPAIRIWDSTTGKMIQILRGHRDSVTCAIQLREGPIVSGSRDSTLKVWDVKTGNCLRTLQGHQGPITSVLQLSENTLLSASESEFGTLKIWNLVTGECLKTIPIADEPVHSLLQLRDGRILSRHRSTLLIDIIKLWDLKRGVPLRKLSARESVFDEIQFQDQVLGKDKIHLDLWHPFLMPLPFPDPDLFSSLSLVLNRLSEQIKEEIFKNGLPFGTQYRCQLTKKILQNPVRLKCGHIFEATAIEKQECPLCKEPIQGPVCIDLLLQKTLADAIGKHSIPRMSVIPVLEVPDEVSAFHNRACLLVEQKEFAKALDQYSEALRFTNRSSAYLPIVQILKDQFPGQAPSALLHLAELQAKEEDLLEIRKTLKSFSELPKYFHNPYLLELLAECALLADDPGARNEAQTFYKLAVEQYESRGQKEDIIRGYEKMFVANLSDFSYYEKLLQLYEDKEKKIALLYMGIFHLRETNPEAAQALVEQAEKLDPDNPLFSLIYNHFDRSSLHQEKIPAVPKK